MLAQGIIRQYERVLPGQQIVRQEDSTLPPELYQAMCKLGRLYIEEGQCDRAACVHTSLKSLLKSAKPPTQRQLLQRREPHASSLKSAEP